MNEEYRFGWDEAVKCVVFPKIDSAVFILVCWYRPWGFLQKLICESEAGGICIVGSWRKSNTSKLTVR